MVIVFRNYNFSVNRKLIRNKNQTCHKKCDPKFQRALNCNLLENFVLTFEKFYF